MMTIQQLGLTSFLKQGHNLLPFNRSPLARGLFKLMSLGVIQCLHSILITTGAGVHGWNPSWDESDIWVKFYSMIFLC
jgi:hypothetical protein